MVVKKQNFASVDRMDFFQNTDNNECLKKLLWIQEIHLSSKNLQSVLPKGSKEKELIDEIQAVHKCDKGKYQILFEIN